MRMPRESRIDGPLVADYFSIGGFQYWWSNREMEMEVKKRLIYGL